MVVTEKLLDAVDRLARELPPTIVRAVAAKLDSMEKPLAPGDLVHSDRPNRAASDWPPSRPNVWCRVTDLSAVALALRASLFTSEKLLRPTRSKSHGLDRLLQQFPYDELIKSCTSSSKTPNTK